MNLPDRPTQFRRLAAAPRVDVLIIGGGINGAGLLRELAINGVKVLLVDRADFAAGATSASSRMIHGGLRYLENGEFRLVRESLHERNRLLKNAPHAVFPLPTTIPLFSRWSGFANATAKFFNISSRPSKRGAALVKIGLTLYDWFAGRDGVLPRHSFQSRAVSHSARQDLHPDIVGTATYHDAWIPMPERLCLELIGDACATPSDCMALNYVFACALDPDGGVRLRDEIGGGESTVFPRIVVNATGAWIDYTNSSFGTPTRFIGGTKGSHLVVEHEGLLRAVAGQQIFYENEEGRICICFPLHGKVLVGSTDLRIDDPSQAVCTETEVDYMLASLRAVFPGISIGREHIISRFCGVRPLPRSESGFTGRISRDHSRRDLPPALGRPWPTYSLVGGKWTTFRAFAEQVTDKILEDLQRPRMRDSRDLRIGQGNKEPDFHDDSELARLVRTEAVTRLDDLLLRRTPLALFERLSEERFLALAQIAAAELDWSEDRLAEETSRARAILAQQHGVNLKPAGARAI